MVLSLHFGEGRPTVQASSAGAKNITDGSVVVAGDRLVWEQHSVPLRNSQFCAYSREAAFKGPRLQDFVGSVKCVQRWCVPLKL